VRTLHVGKPNKVHATKDSGVVCIVRVEKIDVVTTTTRRCARSYDIRLIVALTVHVVKPDDVQTTLGSVAKLDGRHRVSRQMLVSYGHHMVFATCTVRTHRRAIYGRHRVLLSAHYTRRRHVLCTVCRIDVIAFRDVHNTHDARA